MYLRNSMQAAAADCRACAAELALCMGCRRNPLEMGFLFHLLPSEGFFAALQKPFPSFFSSYLHLCVYLTIYHRLLQLFNFLIKYKCFCKKCEIFLKKISNLKSLSTQLPEYLEDEIKELNSLAKSMPIFPFFWNF